MDQPDFGELFDPDLDSDFFDKKQWAKVPEPIRKDVTITQARLGGLPFAQERSIRALFPNMALSDLARRTHDVHSRGRADINQGRDEVRVGPTPELRNLAPRKDLDRV